MRDGESGWRTVGLGLVPVVILAIVLAWALSSAGTRTEGGLALGELGALGVVVGLLAVCLTALTLVMAVLWPGLTERTRQTLESAPGKSLLVGVVNFVFLGALALVLLNLGPIALGGLLLAGLLLLGALVGLPAVTSLVGARLYELREEHPSRWAEIVAGGLVLDLAMLVPVAGWFVVLPGVALWSLGGTVLTVLSKRRGAA